ncbi:MAG TPA: monovalent cation/H(+) antiporter subunit G [Vitreimonas sp.]|jgi:multicomponent Na+:H+ antiporter subunit G|nr:monovalent cation/H(+) antiporter subunit G [Vitreimonas sp.]
MQAVELFDTARTALGGAVAAVGVATLAVGAIGALRFPDFYTRLHAKHAGHMIGAPLVLAGLGLMAHDWGALIRLLLLMALIIAVAPVLSHVLANAAHAAGLAPITGKYVSPRPGERRS